MKPAKIIPLSGANAGDDAKNILEEKTQEEKNLERLEKFIPHICNDVGMIIARPFRFHWDSLRPTASTDCKSEIYMPQWFFMKGNHEAEVGFGSVYHECGHILFSGYGVSLLKEACRQGGETRQHIMNLILDRKDDKLLSAHAPGFSETLWKRLAYISTLVHRERCKEKISKTHPNMPEEQLTKILKHWKPKDIYEDFFFSSKCRKSPKFPKTHKAMKYLASARLSHASNAELLWIAEKAHKILGDMPEPERTESETNFCQLCVLAMKLERGEHISVNTSVAKQMQSLLKNYTAKVRTSGVRQLLQMLQSQGIIYPGPISVGVETKMPLKKIPPNQKYERENGEILATVRHLVDPLVKRLRRIDNPSEFILHGQEEGELDLTQTARIAVGLPGIYKETVLERDIDADIHLAIDSSGSMTGGKIRIAKQIACVFSQAILALSPSCSGKIWGFSSRAIYDFGAPSPRSGLVTLNGEEGNSDTHLLKVAGTELAKSHRRRKVLIVIGDDGPDSIELAGKLSHQLLARGIITIHLLVEVHGTPNIYPIELIYDSMEDCLEEFSDLLEKIIKNIK